MREAAMRAGDDGDAEENRGARGMATATHHRKGVSCCSSSLSAGRCRRGDHDRMMISLRPLGGGPKGEGATKIKDPKLELA